MRIGQVRLRPDWGVLGVATGLTAFCVWLFADAKGASDSVQNLILIAPATALSLVLLMLVLIEHLQLGSAEDDLEPNGETSGNSDREPSRRLLGLERFRLPAFVFVLGIYLVALPFLGFDVATFGFMGISLALQGERRPLMLIGFSAAFAIATTAFFNLMLPLPPPSLLFG